MRVLHVIHGLTTGGAEIDLVNKMAHLGAQGLVDSTVLCLMRRGELADHAERQGLAVLGPLMRGRNDLTAVGSLRRQLRRAAPGADGFDLVHSHLFAANAMTWLALRTVPRAGRPRWLAAEHAMAERWSPRVLWMDRQIARMAAAFVVPSQTAAASYRACRVPGDVLRVVPNAIDVARFDPVRRQEAGKRLRAELGLAETDFVAGAICRLEPVKNLPLLVEAVAPLPLHLLIVGDGSQRAALAGRIAAAGLSGKISLLGRRDDVADLLAAFDLLVLPSASESFGLVVAEALLMQTPVVATAVGAIPEITGNGAWAALVAPNDRDALQAAIRHTMDNLGMARARTAPARNQILQTYATPTAAQALHTLYREIAA